MDDLTISLTAMAHGGAALGRDTHGRVVFVPYGIPGETVRVQPTAGKERYTHANLIEVVEPSPHRIEPRCRHFGCCGGCHFQHIAYPAQLLFKSEIVRDQLARVGKIQAPSVEKTLPSPAIWEYRNSASFSPTDEGRLGYWSHSEEQVIPIDECHILQPPLQNLYRDLDLELPGLRRLTLRTDAFGDLMVVFEIEEVEPPALEADFPVSASMLLPTGEAASLIGENYLVERCAGREWRVSAGSFFQVNPPAAEHLVRLVNDFAELRGSEAVLELYCGVGLFAAGLSAASSRVVGVEASPDAVADAGVNLDHTENVELYQGLAEAILADLADQAFDVAVLDPPRSGSEPAVVDALAAIRPNRIVYVSCDPATFARDARRLGQTGYRLQTVQPVDMFPQTFHVETVSLLELKTG